MYKIIISHRGNLDGKSKNENTLSSIMKCLDIVNLNVEVDVWYHKHNFWLGHDEPTYLLHNYRILQDTRIWCHAKNLEAARQLKSFDCHFFWHQKDDFTITSSGFFWTYPGKKLCNNSIAVLPEIKIDKETIDKAIGVCTDFPLRYIEKTNRYG